jgi:beta-mannanase
MIKAFEEMSGKKIVWAYVSWHWDKGIKFPVSACEAIRAAGAEPLVGVMPWSSLNQGYPEPEYTLERIARGAFDDELYHAADIVRSLGYPIMMEFGPEVNGSWFPWNGAWNGRDADEYGEPGEPDGPERFRDAYRHIADIFRMGGGDVTWVFHVSSAGSPSDEWNAVSRYYPGDGWVDWIGVSVYGRLKGGGLRSFGDIMEGAYPGLCALSPSKPIAVLEMGVSEGPGKAEWIKDAFAGVNSGRYPRVRAVSWWNKASRPDGSRSGLEIDSSPESLAAYREGVGNLIDEAVWIDD